MTNQPSAVQPRVKYCGITRVEDAMLACEVGVDALGFVFYERSPRNISPRLARDIIAGLPPFVTAVGLFVDAETDFVREVAENTGIGLLQFHGEESAAQCDAAERPYIKALKVRDAESLERQINEFPRARGILIDSYVAGIAGGTGQTFNWAVVPPRLDKPLIVAGGLAVDNVRAALEHFRPYAVDVSSGIESDYGIKDATKMREFMTEVKQTNGQR